jgi:hypothetical protein
LSPSAARRAIAVAGAALALCQVGCFSFVADEQAGLVASTAAQPGRVGAAFASSVGANASLDDDSRDFVEHVGPGAALRVKVTRDVQQFALGPHAYWLQHGVVSPYARAGVNLLQFEHVDGGFGFGMFSPYAEAGVRIFPVVVSGFVEYDLRFTHQANEGFFGVMLGWGIDLSSARK